MTTVVSARKVPRSAGGLLLLALALLTGACERGAASGESGVDGIDPKLSRTFDSPEELGRTVLEALRREDAETLKSLPLTREEFRLFVWPKLPASGPERNVPFEYAWGELSQKSRGSIATKYARLKGKKLELVSLRFAGEVTDYGSFIIHRDARLRVETEDGSEHEMDLFGSVLEWRGKYKLFSYVTD